MTLYCYDCGIALDLGMTHCPRHGTDEQKKANRAIAAEYLTSQSLADHPLLKMIKGDK